MYNFEQAVEGLAHGIPVKRKLWIDDEIHLVGSNLVFFDVDDFIQYPFTLNDFYATDWIDASEVVS